MSNYTKTTNFTAKDTLSSGDPNKLVKGAEHDTEYDAIETAVNSKLDAYSGATDLSSAADADVFSIYDTDAGAYKKITSANFKAGISTAADDITTGDAAVTIATSSGDITIDAQGNDTDIYFKGTDGGVDTEFLKLIGDSGGRAKFNAEIKTADGTASSPAYHFVNDTDTGMFLNHTAAIGFATQGAERVSIDGSRLGVTSLTPAYSFETGTPNIAATTPTGNEGNAFTTGGNYYSSSDSTSHMIWNDCSTGAGTHNYVIFRYRGSTIGDIDTTNNSTIRYNTFTGAHWSQFEDGEQPELKLGTVLSTINELMEWTHYRYTESLEGEGTKQEHENTVKIAGTHSLSETREISTNEDGETTVGTPTKHETAERLPKCEVSSVTADTCVYGVFAGHYEDGDTSIEALGAGIILIAQGTTVSRGDLLESAGDGTARPQSDTTIKSSTIAKVTSTVKVKEYDDGSYCVPCTLMCG